MIEVSFLACIAAATLVVLSGGLAFVPYLETAIYPDSLISLSRSVGLDVALPLTALALWVLLWVGIYLAREFLMLKDRWQGGVHRGAALSLQRHPLGTYPHIDSGACRCPGGLADGGHDPDSPDCRRAYLGVGALRPARPGRGRGSCLFLARAIPRDPGPCSVAGCERKAPRRLARGEVRMGIHPGWFGRHS